MKHFYEHGIEKGERELYECGLLFVGAMCEDHHVRGVFVFV